MQQIDSTSEFKHYKLVNPPRIYLFASLKKKTLFCAFFGEYEADVERETRATGNSPLEKRAKKAKICVVTQPKKNAPKSITLSLTVTLDTIVGPIKFPFSKPLTLISRPSSSI